MKFFNKIASSLMIAAALTTSCSQDAMDSEAVVNNDDRVVTFTINEPAATRGSILTNDTFESLTIYVVNSECETPSKINMVKDEDGVWEQTGIVSLPSSGTTTFYALSDQRAGSEASGVTFEYNEGDPYVSYSMPTDVASQPTLVMAEPVALEANASSLNVTLNFHYTLSIVGFTTSGDYKIESLSIKNFKNGANIAFGDTYTPANFSKYTTATDELPIKLLETTDYSDVNYLMIPVQNLAGAVVTAGLSYNDGAVENKTITLLAKEDLLTCGYLKYINLNTGEYVDTSDVEITADSYDLEVLAGKTVATNATPSRPTTITWKSEDESIATVDGAGVITGVKGGETTVTATPLYGSAVEFTVKVYNPITGISFDKTEITMAVNKTVYISYAIYPEDDPYREPNTYSTSIISDTYLDSDELTGSPYDYVASCNYGYAGHPSDYTIQSKNPGLRVVKTGVYGSMSGTLYRETITINVYDPDLTITVTGPGEPTSGGSFDLE
ncbi:MAG: Ig-like domain-containing protein [Rikenellaceae bacterium]